MAGLLAGLDALVVATGLLFAMFLVGAVLRPLLVAVLSQAPFIGGWLASNVDAGLARFQASIRAPADASIGLLALALEWIAYQGTQFLNGVTGLAGGLVTGLWNFKNVTLPHGLHSLQLHAEALVDSARSAALLGVQRAEALAKAGEGAVLSEATALVNGARSEAQGLFERAEAETVLLEGKAEALALDLVNSARAEAQVLASRAEAVAAQLTAAEREFAAAGLIAVETDLRRIEAAAGVALSDTAAVLGADITEAERRAAAAAQQLTAPIEASMEGLLASIPWQALAAAVGLGEEVLKADVRALVIAGAAEIRSAMGDAASIRARYGPQVRAALADLKARS
jgi:hypothetical protein